MRSRGQTPCQVRNFQKLGSRTLVNILMFVDWTVTRHGCLRSFIAAEVAGQCRKGVSSMSRETAHHNRKKRQRSTPALQTKVCSETSQPTTEVAFVRLFCRRRRTFDWTVFLLLTEIATAFGCFPVPPISIRKLLLQQLNTTTIDYQLHCSLLFLRNSLSQKEKNENYHELFAPVEVVHNNILLVLIIIIMKCCDLFSDEMPIKMAREKDRRNRWNISKVLLVNVVNSAQFLRH